MRRGLAIGIAAVLLLAGCSSEPPPEPTPLMARAEGQGFILAMALPAEQFGADQAIDVRTTLTWTGAAPNVTIWGSGMGPVTFVFEELTGRHRTVGGAMTADCGPHPFARGVATPIPLRKTAAWTDDDPDAIFYREFIRDPKLHLPPGRWRIRADLGGYLAECQMNAPAVSLRTAVEFGVG